MTHPSYPPSDDFTNWRTGFGECGNDAPCVEVGDGPDGWKAIRDTKQGADSPVLAFTPQEWTVFLNGAREGQFD
ncbi:DUF397 domain-containing protein [Longispora albida]|uniref:DUF397 domain-containing protein n=1 Tax=Longispora albida TaxID=203523 RepID=UPI0003A9CB8F|nr:DUF397 domain-containing protein [Longispora albida]